MEAGRTWQPSWGHLQVNVEKTWTVGRRWSHEEAFTDDVSLHFPYSTLLTLVKWRPEVIISAQFGFRTAQAALYRRIFPRSRLIVWATLSERTERGRSRMRALQRRVLLNLADAALVNGVSGENYLKGLGMTQERIFRLPYCPEISQFLDLPPTRGSTSARRFLYVGQLVERKGLFPFLAVLSDWCRKHQDVVCEFWIAGHGPLRSELETAAVPPNLQRRLLGAIEYGNLSTVYAEAGILVFPTLADEWGVVVNEALAAGMPVLGSVYAEAVNEMIEDGKTGWTFCPDQPSSVYEAIDRSMACTVEQLNDMRRVARQRACCLSPKYGTRCFLEAINFARGQTRSAQFVETLEVGEER